SVVQWLPVFVSEAACRIVTDSLKFCQSAKQLRVSAYVLMPTHLQAIVFHGGFDGLRLQADLVDYRKVPGRQRNDRCARHLRACFSETLHAQATVDRERRFWQPSRHPEWIESSVFWRQKLDYLHENPCRKGLVLRADHWRFSSAAYYLSDGQLAREV